MFSIEVDRLRNALTITFESTFWSSDGISSFGAELARAHDDLNAAPGTHLVLVDLRRAILQSQDTIAGAQKLVATSTAARIALVASSALARMQTKRLKIRENVVLFEDVDAAWAWLLEARPKRRAFGPVGSGLPAPCSEPIGFDRPPAPSQPGTRR